MENTIKVRIKFKKFGAVKYIGHLDVMRYFQKTIRRAELDIAYSSGYSPHQIMTFAAPLGVGIESNGEYMDIEMNSFTTSKDVMDRLNKTGVYGIEVIDVKVLPEYAGNAMASVAAAEYTVGFFDDKKPDFDFDAHLNEFLSRDEILFVKETKKGTREVNLKPGIYKLSWDGEVFKMLLNASSSENIKPIQVIESMLKPYDVILQENALCITREEVYTNTGSEEQKIFTPLCEIGNIVE